MDTLLLRCRTVFVMTLFTCILSLTGCASMLSNDGAKKEWLFVHTAEDAQVKSATVIVMTAERDIFAFTDRPNRLHKYLTPEVYVSLWNDNGSADNFFTDPPNAVLTWLSPSDGVHEAEIVLTYAKYKNEKIEYTFKFLSGQKLTVNGQERILATGISLFVDDQGMFGRAGYDKMQKEQQQYDDEIKRREAQ